MLSPRKSLVTRHHESQALALDSLWIPLCVLVSSHRETQYLVNNSNFIFPHVWSVRGCLLWSR